MKYQIALTLIKGIGPKTARQLIISLGCEENIFKEKQGVLRKYSGLQPSVVSQFSSSEILDRAEEEVLFVRDNKILTFHINDERYPQRLLNCDDAPTLLYAKGEVDLNDTKVIGIVGTRHATEEGKANCTNLVRELSVKYPNIIIVSGLAYGIDICAHRASLQNKIKTVAVVGHGLDRIYPYVHRNVARDMISNGAVLTEFLSCTEPERQNFVKRNRIIAGLCDAVIVVESGIKGGALITARIAESYNRDVLTYPGRVSDTYSQGCNWLIKKNIGALIESSDDLDYCLGWIPAQKRNEGIQKRLFQDFKSDDEKLIYNRLLIDRELDINQLCRDTQLTISKASTILLNFEFMGIIKNLPGNKYRLI